MPEMQCGSQEFVMKPDFIYFWFQNGTILSMATITLKNIPEALYERLKYFAKLHHRSLNSEIIYNLEKSVGLAEENPEQLRKEAEVFRGKISTKGKLTPEDIEEGI